MSDFESGVVLIRSGIMLDIYRANTHYYLSLIPAIVRLSTDAN
jgi:hypothetical protein